MSLTDRLVPLCDLLLGAAYADEDFKDRERDAVKRLLGELSGSALSDELEAQIAGFDAKVHDVAASAAAFADDSEDNRKRVLHLVAAIHDADEELDFSEDDYLRAVAAALKLDGASVDALTIDVEVEELRADLAIVRKPPPPPPAKPAAASVDVDMD